ncbi:CYTH and CHAD domain-containing protein [Cryobacterium sp. Y11]|uniref:CYTH and CHAD domain-containing protein n=1 Tax=Cryobacterium sp. Y11 TaxID=2045016 RepID=UPI000CE319DF|nr:CYTH and CHAD domain-containing protein [Cryobacterium sp. Y11]
MDTNGGIETELKFDVDEAALLPRLTDIPGVQTIAALVTHDLEAVYFDTADLVLTAAHITLRRRTGGDDAGWHLKLPLAAGRRHEIHAPLGKHVFDKADAVPESLTQLVRFHIRDTQLVPVAQLHTHRVVHSLIGVDGETLAVLCDDHVRSERLVHDPTNAAWREWEIELVDGPDDLLDAARSVLASGGILVSVHASKLARALGDRFPGQAAQPGQLRAAPRRPRPSGWAGDVLVLSLHEQFEVLRAQDPQVRQATAGAVHAMRVATRRLRSVLATYHSLLDATVVLHLRSELVWLGTVLGGSRDEEVLQRRLIGHLDREPDGLLLGPIRERLGSRSDTDSDAAHQALLTALDTPRYFRLLDALSALVASAPFTDVARSEARTVVPKLINKEWKKLRRAVRAATKTTPGAERDLALHEARKRAKRLRYAAETAHPLRPKRAAAVSRFAQKLQTILGDQHDSVIARHRLLQRGGVDAYLRGENTFSYGRLHALEQQKAAHAEARFWRAWSRRP